MLVTPNIQPLAKIVAIGVGGCGGNAIDNMISQYSIEGVEFVAINTDSQALKTKLAPITITIGETVTKGLGAGGNPEKAEQAAEESIDQLQEILAGSDMVFITAGMGGGTGTGAAPVIGRIAKEVGALTVAVVTKPFNFEGKRKMEAAIKGIENLKNNVDTLIVVPNQKILDVIDKNMSAFEAMRKGDDILAQAVRAISGLVTQTGYMNVDFADVKSIMSDSGSAHMGIGVATGENKAEQAARMATSSPLLEINSINGAKGVLLNIIGSPSLPLHDISKVGDYVQSLLSPDANFIFGTTFDEKVPDDEIQVIAIATGFSEGNQATRAYSPLNPISTPSVNIPNEVPQNNKNNQDDEELDKPAFLRRK